MRLTILDGFRGYFLFFMAVVHIDGVVKVTLGKINHHWLGWVQDAQGFVFISGFVVGLVYGGIYLRRSYAAMRSAVFARLRTIYSYQAGLILILLAMALVLGMLGIGANILYPFQKVPALFTALSLSLVSAGPFMGILPMYIWFMAATPLVLWAFRTDRTFAVLILGIGLWLVPQTEIVDYFTGMIDTAFRENDMPIGVGLGFDIFGWQTLFFAGLYLGWLQAQNRLDLEFLKQPRFHSAFLVGLGLVVMLGLFARIVHSQLITREFSALGWASADRGNLSAIYLIAFFADLFVITWLLVAGPSSDMRWARGAGRALNWVFTARPLVFLGQHSLQVFAWHVLVVYMISICVGGRDLGEIWGSVILILGTLSIYIPAYLHAQLTSMRKARLQPMASKPIGARIDGDERRTAS